MIRFILITAVWLIAGISSGFAQPGSARERQASEYRRLSEGTQRAYSPPRANSPSSSYKSPSAYSMPSSSGGGGSSTSYSSSVGSYSSNYSPYAAEFQRKQAAYNAKLEAQESAWNQKVSKVRSFVASSGIVPNTKENHEKIFFAAYGAGLDVAAITTVIKGSAEAYNKSVARENGMNKNFTGGTKKDCSGSCVETVTYVNGSGVYTGNTKDGAPHGLGTLVFPNGTTLTGKFDNGSVVGGKVRIVYAASATNKAYTYEGGYSNNEQNGFGVTTWGPDDVEEAEYVNGAKQGTAILYRNGAVIKGQWKDDKMIGKHTWTFKSGYTVEKDMDVPNGKETVIAQGRSQLPPAGSKKFTNDYGTVYEGDAVVSGQPYNGKFTFLDGRITVGLHNKAGYLIKGKTTLPDGSTTEGVHENGYITSGKTVYPGGTSFNGTYDKNGYFIKGEVVYPNGETFSGAFKDNKRYRGKQTGDFGVFKGELDSLGSFIVGEVTLKDGEVWRGFFGPKNTKLGYRQTVTTDGATYEHIYVDDANWTMLKYRGKTGGSFTGINKTREGYEWFGMNTDAKGTITSAVLTVEGQFGSLPTDYDTAAKQASAAAQKAIQDGRLAYLAAMKWDPTAVLK
ncbi:hypothetical protein [Pedobacter sp.]|uniref:hypothetical protein n=1 Tax=Pedobacter sp. TaxID=1411316 RepID=UPI003BADAC23